LLTVRRIEPADGKRDALIGLLRQFADSIHADPESLHYSVPTQGLTGERHLETTVSALLEDD
jgi:hypothetical protein